MNQKIFKEIQALKRRILPHEKVILFGSQARGDAHEAAGRLIKKSVRCRYKRKDAMHCVSTQGLFTSIRVFLEFQ